MTGNSNAWHPLHGAPARAANSGGGNGGGAPRSHCQIPHLEDLMADLGYTFAAQSMKDLRKQCGSGKSSPSDRLIDSGALFNEGQLWSHRIADTLWTHLNAARNRQGLTPSTLKPREVVVRFDRSLLGIDQAVNRLAGKHGGVGAMLASWASSQNYFDTEMLRLIASGATLPRAVLDAACQPDVLGFLGLPRPPIVSQGLRGGMIRPPTDPNDIARVIQWLRKNDRGLFVV